LTHFTRHIAFMVTFWAVSQVSLAQQTTTLVFDSVGRLASTPYSTSFTSKSKIKINVDQLYTKYSQVIKDSLTRRAQRMKNSLAEYQIIWDDSVNNRLVLELQEWLDWLQKGSPAGKSEIFSYFPDLSFLSYIGDSAIQIHADNKMVQLLSPQLTPDLTSDPWVVDGFHPELKFSLIFRNLFKESIIDYYNHSITKEAASLSTDDFQKTWSEDWIPDLVALRKTTQPFDSDAANLISELKDKKNNVTDLNQVQSLLDKGAALNKKYKGQYAAAKVVNFIKRNERFFASWLWFNSGDLGIDPFKFTTPEKVSKRLSHTDSLQLYRSLVFNDEYDNLKNKDIASIYKDTLTVRDIAKQQWKGDDYFKRTDSLNNAKANKDSLLAFQRILTNLYSFDYPYRNTADSIAVIQQYNAARHFKRTDTAAMNMKRFPQRSRRLHAANSNVPDNKMPVVVTHNVEASTTLKISESTSPTKDQSSFQKALSDSSGIGGAASAAAIFGKASFTGFGSVAAPNIPTPAISSFAQNNQLSEVVVIAYGENHPPPLPPPPIVHKIGDTMIMGTLVIGKLFLDVRTRFGMIGILNCNEEIKIILTEIAAENEIVNADKLIDSLSTNDKANNGICNSPDFNTFEKKQRELIGRFQAAYEEVLAKRYAMINELIGDTSFVTNLMKTKNLLAPPDKLVSNKDSLADTGLYRSQVFYMNQAQTQIKDAYTINKTTSKDTVPKKVASAYFALTPRHLITLGFGPEITFNKLPVNSVTTGANGQLVISQDIQNIRLLVGIHIYPWKLFNPDNRFFIHQDYGTTTWSRFSLFLGVSVPNPLQNYFTGISADIVPGLKIHVGAQWVWYTKYNILNDEVQNQASALRFAGFYIGLNIDPLSISNTVINAFK
jgi:hypothetical protein